VIPLLVVVWVDLEQAILETDDGKQAKAALEAEHRRSTQQIRAREERLRQLADPALYDREAEKLQQDAKELEAALEAKQEQLLAPIVKRMEKLIDEHGVIDLSEQPIVDPPPSCDATSWLARAYAKPEPPKVTPCKLEKAVYVELDRALAQSTAGQAATKKLDLSKEKSQAELDRRQRQLLEMERHADPKRYEEERREVAQLFARQQREMKAEAQDAEEALHALLRRKLREASLPGWMFIEAIPDQRRLSPHCDATDWAAQLLDGKKAGDLRKACR
jgi:hypothetical protein